MDKGDRKCWCRMQMGQEDTTVSIGVCDPTMPVIMLLRRNTVVDTDHNVLMQLPTRNAGNHQPQHRQYP